MWENFVLVPAAELNLLELTCPYEHCKATLVLNLSKDRRLPEDCPICREHWDGFSNRNLINAYSGLVAFFEMFGAKDMKVKPKFRVSEQENT